MPESQPEADQFGRYRVLDRDTGAKRSVVASQLPHGNHAVLNEPASDVAGDALPVEYPAPKPVAQGYAALKKPELEAEITARNADRDPEGETYIRPEGPGNKAELVAALEADDAREVVE